MVAAADNKAMEAKCGAGMAAAEATGGDTTASKAKNGKCGAGMKDMK